jgi:hypothetical protein
MTAPETNSQNVILLAGLPVENNIVIVNEFSDAGDPYDRTYPLST